MVRMILIDEVSVVSRTVSRKRLELGSFIDQVLRNDKLY
jgi:hypothetical protein